MNCKKKIKIDDIIYEADLDFRTAIKCNQIAEDKNISKYERPLAIIYLVFGENALKHENHYEKLLNWYINYLSCGKSKSQENIIPDMDYEEDKGYIASSFKYDYQYNPYNMEFLSWEEFYNDLSNLSNSEFGNCCILNRVRNLRNFDVSKIKDQKERQKIIEAKQQVALKKNKTKKQKTEKQKESANKFIKALGLKEGE